MRTAAAVLVVVSLVSSTALATDVFNMPSGQTSLQFVTVGDPGNAADADHGDGHRGAVSYAYNMGKHDVTAAQYCQFLNAMAKTDTYGLYNTAMAPSHNLASYGVYTFGITQSGNPGSYAYAVAGNPDFPVNNVTWGDAVRFANWLGNGQPTASQGPGTTETGSYTLNGATGWTTLMAVTRNAGATYVIPTVDEWYKAAYYKGGSRDTGYWLYPTQSDIAPSNVLSSSGKHSANYYNGSYSDPTNFLTAVGAFAASVGPYGTYDMGGDVYQWTEENRYGSRTLRGGSFAGFRTDGVYMQSSYWFETYPTYEECTVGFRVAAVPEPASLSLLALGGLLLARRRRA